MRLSPKIQRSMTLDPTATFLMSLERTSEVRRWVTVGNFGRDLVFFNDSGCAESLFFFSFHLCLDSTKK